MILNLITDRTEADVIAARNIRRKVQNGETLSVSENDAYFNGTLRGGYTYTDLNRVEAATAYITDKLTGMGYECNIISKLDWGISDFFKISDWTRWWNNLNLIKEKITLMSTSPQVPDSYKPYQKANAIEQILADIDSLTDKMQLGYYYLTDIYLGEV